MESRRDIKHSKGRGQGRKSSSHTLKARVIRIQFLREEKEVKLRKKLNFGTTVLTLSSGETEEFFPPG